MFSISLIQCTKLTLKLCKTFDRDDYELHATKKTERKTEISNAPGVFTIDLHSVLMHNTLGEMEENIAYFQETWRFF